MAIEMMEEGEEIWILIGWLMDLVMYDSKLLMNHLAVYFSVKTKKQKAEAKKPLQAIQANLKPIGGGRRSNLDAP